MLYSLFTYFCLFQLSMSFYSLSEDLVLLRAAVEEHDDDEEKRLWLEYASLGLVAIGSTASAWMCLRQEHI